MRILVKLGSFARILLTIGAILFVPRPLLSDDGPSESAPEKQANSTDTALRNKFQKRIYPLLSHSDKGCVSCHSDQSTSNLFLSGNMDEDFHRLLDESYLRMRGVDTLLNRVTTSHVERRMPKDSTAWSKKDIKRLRNFLQDVRETEETLGVASDEQFPRSLLQPYQGDIPDVAENQFLSFRQLQGKIKVLFQDDWIRNNRDLFSENIAMLGGADFKTRFNESTQPSATFLTALEMLARDVSNRAFEQRTGPFLDWTQPAQSFDSAGGATLELQNAVQQLFQHILFRPATPQELSESIHLMTGIQSMEDSIARRDYELEFELRVADSKTGLSRTQRVEIPVRGKGLFVKQVYVKQSKPSAFQNTTEAYQPSRQILAKAVTLEPGLEGQCLIVHNVGTQRNVSFAGLELLDQAGHVVAHWSAKSTEVVAEGAWQIEESNGLTSLEDRNQNKGSSFITVPLDVKKLGQYDIALLYRDDVRNADDVLVEIFAQHERSDLVCRANRPVPALGEATFYYDCGNDSRAFAEPDAVFDFDESGYVQITNAGTLDTVTAGAVALVKSGSDDPSILIDSIDAEGSSDWKRFDEGRFKAYNVKGTKIHDGNENKGMRTLTFRPSTKTDQGWKSGEYFGVRIYYPGKRDQEVQVPVTVHARQSSPIVEVSHPLKAQSGARVRMDASSSYTVAHDKLDYHWRQTAGPRIAMNNPNSSVQVFDAPYPSAQQAAWVALCSALLRHPDFLFTKPVSLQDCNDPSTRKQLLSVKVAMDLVGRPPTAAERNALVKGLTLDKLVDQYLDSQEFRDFYMHRIRLYLESQGTEIQDEPARLWSYIAFHDRPFQEILTADFTVDASMSRKQRAVEHGKTGVLTTQGFIQGKPGLPHYNYAAQVAMLFLGYIFEVPAEIVEQREGVTALGTTDPNSVCYSCHKILTPLSFQRLNWNDDGEYRTTNEDGITIDASDQNASEDYPFAGQGLEAFALQASKKERFVRTMINTHVHFYFGRPMRYREDERVLYHRLWENVHHSNFKIRDLIRAIVNSPEYLSP